jgi:hypothetical protein
MTDSAATTDRLTVPAVSLLLSDSLSTADILTARRNIPTALNDSVATNDAVVWTAIRLRLADVVNAGATKSAIGLFEIGVSSIGDLGGDTYTGLMNASRALSDTSINYDTIAARQNFPDAINEPAVATDVYTAVLSVAAVRLGDSAATSDLLTEFFAEQYALTDLLITGEALHYINYVSFYNDGAFTGDLLNGVVIVPLADHAIATDSLFNLGIVTALSIVVSAVPTGGAVVIEFPGYFPPAAQATQLTISRSVAGSNVWTVIYQGPPIGSFIDVGDGTPGPLDPNTAFLWKAEDYSGTAISNPIMPASTFISEPDQLTQILLRLLQGAINSMVLPNGVKRPVLTIRMPTNGLQAMPFIVVNLDLIQQTEVGVGEDVPNPDNNNNWTLFANAKRLWRVSILSQDAEERDFYRDTLLAVFRVLKAAAFAPLGQNVTHTFQAASYSSVKEYEGISPGFYCADLMFELDGLFPTAVLTNYQRIQQIDACPTYVENDFEIVLQ